MSDCACTCESCQEAHAPEGESPRERAARGGMGVSSADRFWRTRL